MPVWGHLHRLFDSAVLSLGRVMICVECRSFSGFAGTRASDVVGLCEIDFCLSVTGEIFFCHEL